VFSHTVEAGRISSPLSTVHANTLADGICQTEIQLRRLCFSADVPPNTCLDGTFYAWTASAVGPNPPFVFSYVAGGFPPGVTLDPSGLVSGIPTLAGAFSFPIMVTDALGTTLIKTFTFYIVEITTTTPMPDGSIGTAYSEMLTSTPAVGTWSIIAGALPPGLTLLPTTGIISGTPSSPGLYTFTIGLTI
jgi:hypothetical protein